MRKETTVELDDPPRYDYGEKVRSRKMIRNDGTFPGREVGDVLVNKGDEGYVASIGTFLQQFYIYGVYFPEKGYSVGCRAKELDPMDEEVEPVR
jgi:nitrogen fixation protein NifZ